VPTIRRMDNRLLFKGLTCPSPSGDNGMSLEVSMRKGNENIFSVGKVKGHAGVSFNNLKTVFICRDCLSTKLPNALHDILNYPSQTEPASGSRLYKIAKIKETGLRGVCVDASDSHGAFYGLVFPNLLGADRNLAQRQYSTVHWYAEDLIEFEGE
jgi:hypothetical protein